MIGVAPFVPKEKTSALGGKIDLVNTDAWLGVLYLLW